MTKFQSCLLGLAAMVHGLWGTLALAAIPVDVASVTEGDVSELVFANGSAYALQREVLIFQSAERVSYLKTNANGGPLSEGDRVKKGELLAALQSNAEDAALIAAKARLESARVALRAATQMYQRNKSLRDQRLIDTSTFEQAEAAYEQALSDVRAAEAEQEQAIVTSNRTQLRAAFDGVVAFVNIREGQYFSPEQFDASSPARVAQTAPIVVINPERHEVVLELPAYEGRRVNAGQNAFVIDGGTLTQMQLNGEVNGTPFTQLNNFFVKTTVASVSPALSPGARTVKVRLLSNQSLGNLVDGGHVSAWLEVAKAEGVTTVPVEALVHENDSSHVFVVNEDNTARKVVVDVGLFGYYFAQITDGLSVGQQVVTKGRYRLFDGADLMVNNPDVEGDSQ